MGRPLRCQLGTPALISFSHPMRGENETRKQGLREFVWVGGCATAPAVWSSGPSTLASRRPWGRRYRGTRGPPGRASGRGDAGVYTDWLKWPLGAALGHLCTLLQRELRRVTRAPQPPWCAGGAPPVATSRLVGKPGSARAAPSWGWRLPETLTHKPPKGQKTAWCRRTRRSV